MKKNIILVGFMGTGKSATARIVAKRSGRTFVDMDAVIEQRTGRKISDIFRKDGETRFREMERELVKELSAQENQVVATGGGVVLNPDNIADFSRTGVVICLKATPAVILERVGSHSHRPLLEDGEKKERILRLLDARRAMYDAVPHQIDTSRMTPEAAADGVMEICRNAAP